MTDETTIDALDPALVLGNNDLILLDQSQGDGTFVTKKITAANVTSPIAAAAAAAAVAGVNSEIDVFIVAGQSNAAMGFGGDAAQSPLPFVGTAYYWTGAAILELPNVAAFWSAFAQIYYLGTQRKLCLVDCAVGGSAMAAAADDGAGNWDASGTLYGLSVNQTTAALAALTASGFIPTLRGVLWAQGEKDAFQINADVIDSATYQAAFEAMITRYRVKYGANLPFWISVTGGDDSNDVGYAEVRLAQHTVANGSVYTHIAFDNAFSFLHRENYLESDRVHYTQLGKNEMGTCMAANIIGGQSNLAFQFLNKLQQSIFYLNKVAVGAVSGTAQLDVVSGATALTPTAMIGADINGNTRTDNTRKVGTLCAPNYDIDLQPWVIVGVDAQTASNVVNWGGGFSSFGRATAHNLYAASAPGDGLGTLQATVDSTGTSVYQKLDVFQGSSSAPALIMGADLNDITRTDNTRKLGAFCAPNYDVDLAHWLVVGIDAQSGTNVLNWGGGYGNLGHATSHNFYTASSPGTGAGNLRATIDEAGLNLQGLPTSTSGLSTGQIWNDSGTLKIV